MSENRLRIKKRIGPCGVWRIELDLLEEAGHWVKTFGIYWGRDCLFERSLSAWNDLRPGEKTCNKFYLHLPRINYTDSFLDIYSGVSFKQGLNFSTSH
jgi:hypothetical protein